MDGCDCSLTQSYDIPSNPTVPLSPRAAGRILSVDEDYTAVPTDKSLSNITGCDRQKGWLNRTETIRWERSG